MAVLVDSNVILDVATDDPTWGLGLRRRCTRSRRRFSSSIRSCSPRSRSASIDRGARRRATAGALSPRSVPYEAAFLAGKGFLAYRRRGGRRVTPLPDFYIGAHAAVAGHQLLTRDARRYRGRLPHLVLITPDADDPWVDQLRAGKPVLLDVAEHGLRHQRRHVLAPGQALAHSGAGDGRQGRARGGGRVPPPAPPGSPAPARSPGPSGATWPSRRRMSLPTTSAKRCSGWRPVRCSRVRTRRPASGSQASSSSARHTLTPWSPAAASSHMRTRSSNGASALPKG